MLTLSRKAGEALIIGDNVTVTVLEIRGDPEQAIHKAALAVRETVRNLEAD